MYIRYKKRPVKKGRIRTATIDKVSLIADKALVFKYSICQFFVFMVGFYVQSTQKCKDLKTTNLNLAKYHFMNNNILDAKLRYFFVIKLDKNSSDAYTGLGHIYFLQRKLQKSLLYFNKAKDCSTEEEEIQQIEEIIIGIENEINLKV